MTEAAPSESSGEAIAVQAPSTSRRQAGGTFRSLRYRDFRLLWFSTLFTSSGMWFQQITVGWLVWEMTKSEFLLGSINGFRALPLLLLAPVGGVAADRVERKWLLQVTAVLAFTAATTMTVLIFADLLKVWYLFVFTLLTGVVWSFNNPVRQSIVPSLVPKHELMNALALNSVGFNLMRIVGPAIAGVILANLGAGENFGIQAVAYVGVFLMVMLMVIPPAPRAAAASVRDNLTEGFKYVWTHRTLRTQLVLAFVPTILAFPYMALMPVFATDVYGKGPGAFGVMGTAVGIGAVLGTLALATLSNIEKRGVLLMTSILALGIVLVLYAQIRSFELALVLLAGTGAAQMLYLTTNQTILQIIVPDELRGRVMGLYMLSQGMMPLGGLIGGALASATSAPTAVTIMGALVVALAVIFMVRAKELREV